MELGMASPDWVGHGEDTTWPRAYLSRLASNTNEPRGRSRNTASTHAVQDNGALGPSLRLRELSLPQLPSEHLSDERLRQIGGELDRLRDLEGREAFLAER